ncbi:c-type cytochrome [Verrucomicrobia bacterium]|nr:c-type cytochrome [Verrucomicrobiota bacterium]
MSEEKDPLLMSHEADGIKELDNQLPRWWVWLFNFCILFSIAYVLYYHVLGIGVNSAEAYEFEMEIANEQKAAALEKFDMRMETMESSSEASVLAAGEKTYIVSCSPCHGPEGQGLVGSNLTDDYWIHGSEFKDTLRTISNGVPDKGMIAWKDSMQPSEIYAVASYILTLRGTDPPNPKAPENEITTPSVDASMFE